MVDQHIHYYPSFEVLKLVCDLSSACFTRQDSAFDVRVHTEYHNVITGGEGYPLPPRPLPPLERKLRFEVIIIYYEIMMDENLKLKSLPYTV